MTERERCIQCGRGPHAMAVEKCRNPNWHDIPRPVERPERQEDKVERPERQEDKVD